MLHGRNERLVITRVTGFGQDGPYASRPGFASIAEAMSGYAAITGEPDGPPLLPPIALTDEVTGLVGAFATMVALHSGVGQVVDVNLLESLFQLMGPLISVYRLTGEQQPRLGAGIPYTVPRGTYRCADGQWVAVSTSSDTRGRPGDAAARRGRRSSLRDLRRPGRAPRRARRAAWRPGSRRGQADVVWPRSTRPRRRSRPVMDMADISADPHVAASGMIVEVDGVPMQGLVARLSATPGRLRWAGRALDADGDAIAPRRLGLRPPAQSALATPIGQLTPVPPRPQ